MLLKTSYSEYFVSLILSLFLTSASWQIEHYAVKAVCCFGSYNSVVQGMKPLSILEVH